MKPRYQVAAETEAKALQGACGQAAWKGEGAHPSVILLFLLGCKSVMMGGSATVLSHKGTLEMESHFHMVEEKERGAWKPGTLAAFMPAFTTHLQIRFMW